MNIMWENTGVKVECPTAPGFPGLRSAAFSAKAQTVRVKTWTGLREHEE